MKQLEAWISENRKEETQFDAIDFAKSLMASLKIRSERYFISYVYGAIPVDPRFSNDLNILTKIQWEHADNVLIQYISTLAQSESVHDDTVHPSSSESNVDCSDFNVAAPEQPTHFWELRPSRFANVTPQSQ